MTQTAFYEYNRDPMFDLCFGVQPPQSAAGIAFRRQIAPGVVFVVAIS
jgi:hypothetical protein